MSPETQAALAALLARLYALDYRFVTPTPATHQRLLDRRAGEGARDLRDVLGWSLPFAPGMIDDEVERLLVAAGMIEDGRSRLRVSSLQGLLFLHSAYPTDESDAVFFGPDSYRFADLVVAELAARPCPANGRFVDIGTGAGVGAMVAASLCPSAQMLMTDPNPRALELARINATAAGCTIEAHEAEGLTGIDGRFDVAILNPPYILDEGGPAYRDGGEMHGARLSLDLAREAATRLAPGGRLILYTGSAIIGGEDALAAALAGLADESGLALVYRELDPDVFGEELEQPAYADVERIAVVAATLTKGGD